MKLRYGPKLTVSNDSDFAIYRVVGNVDVKVELEAKVDCVLMTPFQARKLAGKLLAEADAVDAINKGMQ